MDKKHLVLVVDDSPTVRRLVTMTLSRSGYEVITAENGEEGLETAKKETPSLILVDFVMPKMNGFEFCKNIRADSRLSSIPIILITSKGKDVGKGFEENIGISYYLQKPFKPEMLISILEKVLPDAGKSPSAAGAAVSTYREETPSHAKGKGPDKEAARSDSDFIWETISKEVTVLLKRAVMQTLKETGHVRTPGRILSGDLAYISVSVLMKFAALSGISGKLTLFADSFNSELYLDNGTVVFASTSRQGHSAGLEDFLPGNGKSRSPEIRACLEESVGDPAAAGTLLVGRGLMSETELNDCFGRMTEHALNESLAAVSGHFFIEDVPLPPAIRDLLKEKNPDMAT